MRRHLRFSLLALACTLASCGGAPSDPGTSALLHVTGGTFYAEAMPPAGRGPAVESVDLPTNSVAPGVRDRPLGGALGETATSALVGLVGDSGYWVLPAGIPDVATPGFPTFHTEMEFSSGLSPGEHTLRIQAADAAGAFGAPELRSLEATAVDVPPGMLVFRLSWDTEADLDLHVVTPDGVEVFARNIDSVEPPPPGRPVDPAAWQSGGILDIDSNAECVIDGRRQENVVWTTPPPSGGYVVRVDTFSLCNAPAARWDVFVFAGGRLLAHARGDSGPYDAQGSHDRGAGVLALTVDVP